MNNETIHRDIGRVEGEVKALRRDITEMKSELSRACAYIEQQKGARKATIFISSGISGAVAFAVGVAFQVLK